MPVDLTAIKEVSYGVNIVGVRLVDPKWSFVLLVLYIPPELPVASVRVLLDSLQDSPFLYSVRLAIIGDFNVPQFCNYQLTDTFDAKAALFDEFRLFFNLKQYNFIYNFRGQCLDLLFSTALCEVLHTDIPLVFEDKYHPALSISMRVDFDPAVCNSSDDNFVMNPTSHRLNFRKGNFPVLYDFLLSIDWSFLGNLADPNVACRHFYDILNRALHDHIPLFLVSGCPKRVYPPWFSGDIISDLKLKDTLRMKLRSRQSDIYTQQYLAVRNSVRNRIRQAHRSYLFKIEDGFRSNPASFWGYVNKASGKTRIPAVMFYDGRELADPLAIVNAFADFFSSVYADPSAPAAKSVDCLIDRGLLGGGLAFQLMQAEVSLAMKKMMPKLTAGLDRIPSFLVHDCEPCFAAPLCIIFNLALRVGEFPSVWKTARVCPVFKKGDNTDIRNYRPISVLSNFAKLFEATISQVIEKAFAPYRAEAQHGFTPRRSTVTNLTSLAQYVNDCLQKGVQVDIVYTDFSKAFDKIDHAILLSKLQELGISSNICATIRSYLSDRRHVVQYGGHSSNSFVPASGVPQGSILGPLLFNIFINDIVESISANTLLYADDLKIYAQVRDVEDCERLQVDLERVQKWCQDNKLPLNPAKCSTMSFYRGSVCVSFDYHIDHTAVRRVSSLRDLGVTFDYQLSFTQHVHDTACAASRALGFVIRHTKNFKTTKPILALYNALVLSRLEYGSTVWSPKFAKYADVLEKVQKRFLKFLVFKIEGVYPPRGMDPLQLCSRFGLWTLEERRVFASCLFLFKLLNALIDSAYLLGLLQFKVPRAAARYSELFYVPLPGTSIGFNSPVFIMCNHINLLCTRADREVDILAVSHGAFLRALHDFLASVRPR